VVRVFTPSRPVGVGRKRPRPDSSRPEPDYNLAYALATASYCAYGVGQKDADQSHDRAVKCLRLAAKAGSRLNGLDVGPNNVEAYVNPVKPVDAYLLINAKDSFKTFFSGLTWRRGQCWGARHSASTRISRFFSSVQKLACAKDKTVSARFFLDRPS
jgi:hypothetical protein